MTRFIALAAVSLDDNVSQVYLTNDMGFPKENLTIIKVVCTPLNIAVAFLTGGMAGKNPFKFHFTMLLVMSLLASYSVLVMLGTFPQEQTLWTYLHVVLVFFLKDLAENLEFTVMFSILMQRTDQRISGVHVTAMAMISNFASFIHKFNRC